MRVVLTSPKRFKKPLYRPHPGSLEYSKREGPTAFGFPKISPFVDAYLRRPTASACRPFSPYKFVPASSLND